MANANVLAIREAGNAAARTAPSYPTISQQNVTFAEAAASYRHYRGNSRHLDRVVDYLGDRAIASIVPFDIEQMAYAIYPFAKNSTRNRQALTPARAVIMHGYDRGWCNLMRLKRLKEEPPVRLEPATPVWLHAFVRQCAIDKLPHVAAIVLFMSQTGARVSEAIRLEWPQVDLHNRKVILLKTKTGTNSKRGLSDEMVTRLHQLKEIPSPNNRVFRYVCRHSVNERIQAVCQRAGIKYKPTHTCGRHAYANNILAAGVDIKTAMIGGGWECVEVFMGTYVRGRQNAERFVADSFNGYQFSLDI